MSDLSGLVLLSGGMDSLVLLAQATARLDHVEALFVNYGQRHICEREASQAIASYYRVAWTEIDLRGFGASVESALTCRGLGVPHGHYTAESMKVTVVPNRNATFLSAAAGVAASRELDVVMTAVHAGDHAVYADCRPEFIAAIDSATQLGCGVAVVAPFVAANKATIAAIGGTLDAPFELSWSCYEGKDQHCGRCGTCVERREAFHLAGLIDPTEYRDPDFWLAAVEAARSC